MVSLKASNYREKLSKAGHLHWFHWFIILFSSLLTFLAWSYSHQLLDEKIKTKFQREANSITKNIRERMELYENVLWSGVGVLSVVNGNISYQQWFDFSNKLKIDKAYPGINGIGVIYNIKKDHLDDYLSQQKISRPNYFIHPNHENKEFWPITYIEPVNINKSAVGLDIAFESNRFEAVIKARDTATAQITAPIVLVQDDLKTPGFLFYAPFYKNGTNLDDLVQRQQNIIGVTYAPFIMYKLMDGVLAQENRHIHLKIYDDQVLLYSDDEKGRDTKPLFTEERIINKFGRDWTYYFESDLSFRNEVGSQQPMFILIGGIILDFLLLTLFVLLTKANKNALNYADQVNKELLRKAEQLEKSNQDLQQFSYVASHDLKSPLNAVKQLASWIKEDCESLLPEESKKHLDLLNMRTERMMKLLSDLLSYARLSNNRKFDYKRINLNQVVIDSFELNSKASNFTCTSPDVEIEVPFIPFEIVIRNLISNAIKHHDLDKGTIVVTYQKNETHHMIEVIDDGPGIPENLHDKAMEMFQTLKPRDEVEGSGMGLAMVKKIVEKYKGTITIKADSSRGTTFIVTWPLKENFDV